MSNHTPGPWDWEPMEVPDLSAGIIGGTPPYVWTRHPDRKLPPDHPNCDPDAEMVICEVRDTVYPIDWDPDGFGGDAWHGDPNANARLIAAAPELLEVAQALIEDREECGIDENDLDDPLAAIVRKAREAVTKATGQKVRF